MFGTGKGKFGAIRIRRRGADNNGSGFIRLTLEHLDLVDALKTRPLKQERLAVQVCWGMQIQRLAREVKRLLGGRIH